MAKKTAAEYLGDLTRKGLKLSAAVDYLLKRSFGDMQAVQFVRQANEEFCVTERRFRKRLREENKTA